MKISFNKLNSENTKENEKITEAVRQVIESGHYVLGNKVKEFENDFAKYIGAKYAVGVGNGFEALQIALIALGIGEGDEVITTPLSAVATALAIKAVGAKPIFVDIDDFYHVDADKIEGKITSKTKVIMPVHLYGQAADMDKIIDIAKKHNLYVVEDCAQAHGTEYGDKKVGNFGIFGCFSFYPTKNLGAIGDAGAIVTKDENLAEKCKMIRNYGQKNRYEHEICGINSRLDELQAAILFEKLKYLDEKNKKRQKAAEVYLKELKNVKEIKLPGFRKKSSHIYHLFVIETEKRDELQKFLKEKEIDTLVHYPIPIHKQKCFAEYNNIKLPETEKKVQHILSLPIHPYLTEEEVIFVCDKIKEFFSKNGAK